MTRTIAFGKIDDEQREVYSIVLEAQERCLDALKAGLKCAEADAEARNVIKETGYGDFFKHSTGHGVGVEVHEAPGLYPSSKKRLEEGNVITVEPGIYLPSKFGVRIEDMAYIQTNGSINLTKTQKDLILL